LTNVDIAQAVAVALADFNGDGRLDCAVTNYGTVTPGVPGAVSILYWQASGGFGGSRAEIRSELERMEAAARRTSHVLTLADIETFAGHYGRAAHWADTAQ